MNLTMVAVIAIGILLFLILMGVHISISMFAAGLIGFALVLGIPHALRSMATAPYAQLSNYALITLPLFLLMSEFGAAGNIARDLFQSARLWLAWLPSGLAVTTIGCCAGFAAVSGSSAATCAAIGKLAIPEMRQNGYSYGISAGSVAIGGTLGIMIPPSIPLVIYGMLTNTSIGRLLIAGVLPGIMISLALAFVAVVWGILKPSDAPRVKVQVSLNERFQSIRPTFPLLVLVAGVMGSLYFGLATATEAAAFGAALALIMGLALKRLNLSDVWKSTLEATVTSAMILFIVGGATYLSVFIALSRLPNLMSDAIAGLQLGTWGLFGILTIFYIILGMFLEGMSMQVLTLPVIFPMILELGIDPIWFGIYLTLMIEIAQVTPPVGMNLYVIGSIDHNKSIFQCFMGVLPFFIAIIVCIVLLMQFPQIALFLPNLMWG